MKPSIENRLQKLEAIAGRESLPEIVFTCGDEVIATLKMRFDEPDGCEPFRRTT